MVLGIIEGVADAVTSFTKMFSGYFADHFGHRKSLVLTNTVVFGEKPAPPH